MFGWDALAEFFANLGSTILKYVNREPAPPPVDPLDPNFDAIRKEETDALKKKREAERNTKPE